MLVAAFEEANRRVIDKAADDPSMDGMGTTLVAALEMGSDNDLIMSAWATAAPLFTSRGNWWPLPRIKPG